MPATPPTTEPTGPAPQLPTLRQLLARVHLRLILFAVTLAAASLMVSGVLVIRNYAQQNLNLLAKTVAYTVEPAVVFEDRQAINDGMVSVAAISTVNAVEVRDPSGRVLASWHNQHGAMRGLLVDTVNRLIWPDPAIAQVKRGDQVLAQVRVYGSSGGMLRYLAAALLIALACIGLTVFAARILARRLQRDVIDPLDHVAAVAHAVRSDRAFEKRVPASGIAEIDHFGQDFNALLAELQGWHAGLTSENAELQRLATHDDLTGLGNRGLFERQLREAVGEAQRNDGSIALIHLDVDHFKQVNDLYGHDSGDAALIAVGERLRGAIRVHDAAFRLGGDEFAVLLIHFQSHDQVDSVVSRIRHAMESPFRMPSGLDTIATLSVGVALFPGDGSTAEELLRSAASAMYREKKLRRDGGPEGTIQNA